MSCTSATYDSTTTPQKCRSIRKLLIQKYLYNNFNLEISNLETGVYLYHSDVCHP